MKKFFFSVAFFSITLVGFLFSLIISLAFYHSSSASLATRKADVAYAALPTNQNTFSTEIVQQDGRVESLKQFFRRYGSPLEPFAEDVVESADQYGLDWRLIPAIGMQESNLCHKIPENSYNCWGFGIYGKTVTRFDNYKDAIYTVTKTLATKYKTRGLVTPEEIMTMYTPSSNGSWARGVNEFMGELE
jgi:hypothetical protein